MSVVASTSAQVCNSPLNLSKSKMLYSFSKAERFGVDSKAPCSQICYDLPPLKDSRTTSLGYGQKYDFTKAGNGTPAPNVYQIKDFVLDNKKKGPSFGLSREAMAITGGMLVGDRTSPGPGAYDTRETNKVAISYTFKSRTTGPEGQSTAKNVPGPGTYVAYNTLAPSGSYFVSKYKSSGATTFSPSKGSGRFTPVEMVAKLPGPGAYDLNVATSPNGTYFVSKFHDSGARKFGTESRSASALKSINKTPGPGSYKLPSDFGYYEAKNKVNASGTANIERKSTQN